MLHNAFNDIERNVSIQIQLFNINMPNNIHLANFVISTHIFFKKIERRIAYWAMETRIHSASLGQDGLQEPGQSTNGE